MRVRLVTLFLIIALAWSAIPPTTFANSTISVIFTHFITQKVLGIGPNIYESALKTGDTPQLKTCVNSGIEKPTISIDVSQFGVASSTVTHLGSNSAPGNVYYNGIQYHSAYCFNHELVVGSDIPDGVKTIAVSVADSRGNTADGSAQIVVDNTTPTISLSNIEFSATPPKAGDTMYLSGSADGTGSALTIYQIRETIWDKKGNPIWGAGFGTSYNNTSVLTSAIAASPDGSFTRVPFTLIDTPTNDISTAATVRITITAYDESGHVVTTSLEVPVPQPPPPDPCIAAGTCASNVLFLPGIEGSRLYEGVGCGGGAEEKLWEPLGDSVLKILRGAGDDKVKKLFLDSSGRSVCSDVYAKPDDILDSVRGNAIYKSFVDEMNGLKTDGTIKDWRAAPYDWRLSLGDLLSNGAERGGNIYYNEATSTPYIEQTLRALAGSSKTGKVTVVAHSNGGLVAKALLNQLGGLASKSLVDKLVMVGAPQSGAPLGLGALLYGMDQGLDYHGIPIVHSSVARDLALNSPMAYHLLPSEDYLESIAPDLVHRVARFAGDAYAGEITAYGSTIGNVADLDSFIRSFSTTNAALVDYANSQHAALDFWTPPDGIAVSQIAGWGVDTVAGIDFYTPPPVSVAAALSPLRGYRPIFTEDGDGTVPVPSALMMASSTSVKRYWVNLDKFNREQSSGRKHKDIFEVPQLEEFIKNIIENSTSTLPTYISTNQPSSTSNKRLTFFLHSPLTLELADSSGNVTGLATDGSITQDIPSSTYGEFGEVKYVTVPQGSPYTLTMRGQESGTFSLDIQESTGGVVSASTTLANVPTTENTLASLTITNGIDTASALTVDKNGDGSSVVEVAPKAGETVSYVEPRRAHWGPQPIIHIADTLAPEPVAATSTAVDAIAPPAAPQTGIPDASGTVAIVEAVATGTEPISASRPEPVITTEVPAAVRSTPEEPPITAHDVAASADAAPDLSQAASVYGASQQPIVKSLGTMFYTVLHGLWRALMSLF